MSLPSLLSAPTLGPGVWRETDKTTQLGAMAVLDCFVASQKTSSMSTALDNLTPSQPVPVNLTGKGVESLIVCVVVNCKLSCRLRLDNGTMYKT